MDKKLTFAALQPAQLLTTLFDQPYLLLILATLFWSGNFVLGRAVRADVPPIGLAFWRWAGGSILIIGFAWPHLKRDWPLIRRRWKFILLLAILGVTLFNTLVYTGLQFTTAINALLMQSTMPVLIVLMSYLFYRETVTPVQTVGVLLSLAGVLVIVGQGNLAMLLGLSLNLGDLLIFIAVAGYAAYSALLRQRPPLHPLSLIAATFIAGAVVLLPFYLWEHTTGRTVSFDRVTLLTIGYVAIFPSILAYLCFNRGVELAGANRAGLFIHLMPVFGSIMAILFLGERFQWFHGFGILLILIGILLATRRRRH
ncbi:MAG: EamA/RhaT family transporter [Anaerolineae bacterium]|nr:DMT family transporter [Anaerolineales bacterium]MCQ3974887.1 EamA/RhaT family transporter [Anaerolineae bacterium]